MPEIQLTFPSFNFSAQVGDIAYYCETPSTTITTTNDGVSTSTTSYNAQDMNNTGGFTWADQSSLVTIGEIISISQSGNNTIIVCEASNSINPPSDHTFILFSKNNAVNMSSITGYYAEMEFSNNSYDKAEMFSTTCNIEISSK